ncbi:unnamed protein product [Absidia cylindrospora]
MEGETSSTTAAVESGTNQTRATQTQTPPTQPSATTTTRSSLYGSPSRTVRTNWIYYLRASWRRIHVQAKLSLEQHYRLVSHKLLSPS